MTDNGSCYVSKLFAGVCRRLKHLRTRPYTPRTNGKAERLIRTLQGVGLCATLCAQRAVLRLRRLQRSARHLNPFLEPCVLHDVRAQLEILADCSGRVLA
jgi:transposase InsO family protein